MPKNPLRYDNRAVPLYDEVEFTQRTPACDIVTISAHSANTADFLACANSSGTQLFAVGPNGNIRPRVYTTRPTTGLTKGEVMVLFHGSTPKIGICSSTAAQTIKLIRLKTKTFGRLTA